MGGAAVFGGAGPGMVARPSRRMNGRRNAYLSGAMLHGTVPHPVQCGLAKPEQHHQMLALAGRVRTKASFGPSEEVSQPGRRRREGAQGRIGVHFRLLQSAAALRRPPRAVAGAVLARDPYGAARAGF